MDAVLNWVWQGSVVAVALAVLLRLLERARANVRYVVSWVALLLVMALPAVSWMIAAIAPAAEARIATAGVVSVPDVWWASAAVMLAAWAAWAGVRAIGLTVALMSLRRARARSRVFPADLESRLPHWGALRHRGRRASLVLSESVTAAAVLGCGSPTIAVAPSVLTTLDASELDRVLVHEWAHVQRRDDLVQLLQALIRIVAGWHPAIWWIDRRLHVEREIACDERTVQVTGSPKVYAACLVKLAGLRCAERAPLTASAVVRAPGLRVRVTRIVSRHTFIAPSWSRGLAAGIVALLGLLSIGAAGARIVEPAAVALPLESVPVSAPGLRDLRWLAPVAWPAPPTRAASASPVRPPSAPAPKASRTDEQRSTTQPQAIEPAPLPSGEPVAADRRPEPVVEPTAAGASASEPTLATVPPHTVAPAQGPDATAVALRSTWMAAADGGTALGRKSKDAGVATAGFFTRVARRVAGSVSGH